MLIPIPPGKKKRVYTKEQRESIVARFLAGERMKAIALSLGVSRKGVEGVCWRAGAIRNTRLTAKEKREIVARYRQGEKPSKIGDAFDVDCAWVQELARRSGQVVRARSPYQLKANHSAFSKLTPEVAYWIGFLMADGCATGRMLSLRLSHKDRAHLEKFKAFLKSEHAITTQHLSGGTTSIIFSVQSPQMLSDLALYGIAPRKSLTAKVLLLENDRDFWRGVVDGDGSVLVTRIEKYPRLMLTGSLTMMGQFKRYAQGIISITDNLYQKGKIACVQLSGKTAVPVIRELYQDSKVHLDRKKLTADLILQDQRYAR